MLASGYDLLMGVDIGAGGRIVFAEAQHGRVMEIAGGQVSELASGLSEPRGVAIGDDGTVYVAESGAGRVVKVSGGKAVTVVDALGEPQGIAVRGNKLYIVDIGSRQVIEADLISGARTVIASELPVGAPPGTIRKQLGGVGDMCGPMVSFTGIAAADDGTIYVSADAEGSVLALRPTRD